MHAMDWQGVLSGQPLQWIISGFLTTLWVTLAGIVLATLIAISLLSLRLTGNLLAKTMVGVWVSVFRNTPLLVQLMFWYFAAWNWLPRDVISFINADHPWSILPGDVWWLTPEFICSAWGLAYLPQHFWSKRSPQVYRQFLPDNARLPWRRGFHPGRYFFTFCCLRDWQTPGNPLLGNIST